MMCNSLKPSDENLAKCTLIHLDIVVNHKLLVSTSSKFRISCVSDSTAMLGVRLLQRKVARAECPLPDSVPQTVLPDDIIAYHPELQLAAYELRKPDVVSNVATLPHNAVRMEICDFYADILPCLHLENEISLESCSLLSTWWCGFARFVLTTSLVDEFIMKTAYSGILEDFDKDAVSVKNSMRKFREKNVVTLETVMRAMGQAIEELCQQRDIRSLTLVVKSWRALTTTLCDMYALVEKTCHDIDSWHREELIKYPRFESKVAEFYTSRKRWGKDEVKRGERVVMLTRWMGREDLIRAWMGASLTKRDIKKVNTWLQQYQTNRLQIVDHFHDKVHVK